MHKVESPLTGDRNIKKLKNKMSEAGIFVDTCIKIFLVVLFADALQRIFIIVWEFVQYANNYAASNRLWTIMCRAFAYNFGTQILFLLICCVALLRFGLTKRLPLPPVGYMAFIPLYWVLCGVNIGQSTLDYAHWLRKPHGLDYAEGMASNYYLGYLKLTLPQHNESLGIKERIELYETTHGVKFATNRLVIVIPSNMFVHGKIKSNILENTGASLETVIKNRAGVQRHFRNDVFKFNLRNQTYYVAMEGATPLVSFFDALNFPLTVTWQMKEMQREILFKFYKHLKKLLDEWPETSHRAELIFFDSHTADGVERDVGEVVVSHMQSLLLK